MLRIPSRLWALMLISALFQIGMFPIAGPVPLWRSALCWIAFGPLLLALLHKSSAGDAIPLGSSALLGYSCGVLWYMGNCAWIYQTMYLYGGLAKPIAFGILLLFSLYLGLYHALFAVIFTFVHHSRLGARGALLLSPFIWVAVELIRARLTSFPWDLLGNTQVDNQLLTRLAPLTGVMGLSFLILAINAGFVAFVVANGKQRFIIPLVAAVLVLFLQIGGTRSELRDLKVSPAAHHAVLLQENLAVGSTSRAEQPLTPFQELDQFSYWSTHPNITPAQNAHPLGPKSQTDLIVWPEAPSHLQSNDPAFRARLAELARGAAAPLIVGSLGVDPDPAVARGYSLYDSASLFDSAGSYQGRYDKIHLVPWGEFIPFKSFFSFAEKLTEGAGDMDRGQRRTVFRTGGHAYGIFICYESIFGDEVREFVRNGAEVLVNISDDGWYGDTGAPWQHLNMARMRAIENDRWVLRSTNTGITTAIDPQGRIAFEAPRHTRAAFVFPFDFTHGETFYTRHGDWFAYLCALITLVGVAFGLLRRFASPPEPMH